MTVRRTLGYKDFLVTCYWGLKAQVRPAPARRVRGLPSRRPSVRGGLVALCRRVPSLARG